MKSWKTTTVGILGLVIALAETVVALIEGRAPNTEALFGAVAGIGFLFTRDNDKSSEDVGAK